MLSSAGGFETLLIWLQQSYAGRRRRTMKEKRNRQRRSYGAANTFPFTDNNGCVVLLDRSRVADRRLNDLELKELGAERVSLKRVN